MHITDTAGGRDETHCNSLQHPCNTLQQPATPYNTLQHTGPRRHARITDTAGGRDENLECARGSWRCFCVSRVVKDRVCDMGDRVRESGVRSWKLALFLSESY